MSKCRWLCLVPLLLVASCRAARTSEGGPPAAGHDAPPAALQALIGDHTIGAPGIFDNLAVFPVFAAHQEDIGDFTTLEAALQAKTAEVRELDAAVAAPTGGVEPQVANGSAQVNKLVIENRGKLPLLVLAGTVVKGGRQDRQIGADFVIEAGKTVPVDAFCVEHGRWNGSREGADTNGRFKSEGVLAQAEVRAAGQYEHDQGAVWKNVEKVNRDAKKDAATGTLTATLDDREITDRRTALGKRVRAFLGATKPQLEVVGLAYAVDGQVRAVRWFMNHKLFTMYSDTLVETAALDAVTARVARGSAPPPPAAAAAADVTRFVDDVAAAPAAAASAEPAAGNVNHLKKTDAGYGSEAVLKGAKPKTVTSDFIKK